MSSFDTAQIGQALRRVRLFIKAGRDDGSDDTLIYSTANDTDTLASSSNDSSDSNTSYTCHTNSEEVSTSPGFEHALPIPYGNASSWISTQNPPPPGLPIPHSHLTDTQSDALPFLEADDDDTSSSGRQLLDQSTHRHQEWYGAFLAGTHCDSTSKYGELTKHTHLVLCHPSFNVDAEVPSLAFLFAVAGSLHKLERHMRDSDSLAPFTAEMYRTMRAIFGVDASNTFRMDLQHMCLAYFKDTWTSAPDLMSSAMYGSSPPHALMAITAMLSITGYIGELYVHSLVEGTTLNACLNHLLHEMTTIEHIQGVHYLLMRAAGGYWVDRQIMQDFLTVFVAMADQVGDAESMMAGLVYPAAMKRMLVDEVVALVACAADDGGQVGSSNWFPTA